MNLRRFFSRKPFAPTQYISEDVLTANTMMLNNIFRVNEQVLDIIRLLEAHEGDPRADYELRRLQAFREVSIEFATYLYADEGDLLADPVLDRFEAWLTLKIERETPHVDAATLEGYRRLAKNLQQRNFTAPKPIFP